MPTNAEILAMAKTIKTTTVDVEGVGQFTVRAFSAAELNEAAQLDVDSSSSMMTTVRLGLAGIINDDGEQVIDVSDSALPGLMNEVDAGLAKTLVEARMELAGLSADDPQQDPVAAATGN